MNVCEMSIRQLRQLPCRKWDEEITFTSIIVLPAKFDWFGLAKFHVKAALARMFGTKRAEIWEVGHFHDSGFRCLDFVACLDAEPCACCPVAAT